MPIPCAELLELLQQGLPGAVITLTDLAGDDDHYHARIIWDQFKGKSPVHQHQMVYRALQGKMGTVLHALSLDTKVEEDK